MIEIILMLLTPPEGHIRNLKIGPEMTSRVSVRLLIVLRSPLGIHYPIHCIVFMKIFWMFRNKFCSLGPERWNRLWRIVEVDRETVGFIVISHVTEYIVVDI